MKGSLDQIHEVIASALLMNWLQANWTVAIAGVCIGDVTQRFPVFKGVFEVHLRVGGKAETVSVDVEIDTTEKKQILKVDVTEDIKPRYQKLIEAEAIMVLH